MTTISQSTACDNSQLSLSNNTKMSKRIHDGEELDGDDNKRTRTNQVMKEEDTEEDDRKEEDTKGENKSEDKEKAVAVAVAKAKDKDKDKKKEKETQKDKEDWKRAICFDGMLPKNPFPGLAMEPLTVNPTLVNIVTPGDLTALFGAGGAGTVAINNSIAAAFAAGGAGTLAINGAFNVVVAAFGAGGVATIAIGNAINNAINNNMAGITARLDNQQTRAENRAILESSTRVGAAASILVPILKEVAGAGVALPGVAAAALPVGHPFAVGAPIPSPPFPNTVAALRTLTLAQISCLAILYNNDFRIVAGDTAVVRQEKFERFICGV